MAFEGLVLLKINESKSVNSKYCGEITFQLCVAQIWNSASFQFFWNGRAVSHEPKDYFTCPIKSSQSLGLIIRFCLTTIGHWPFGCSMNRKLDWRAARLLPEEYGSQKETIQRMDELRNLGCSIVAGQRGNDLVQCSFIGLQTLSEQEQHWGKTISANTHKLAAPPFLTLTSSGHS